MSDTPRPANANAWDTLARADVLSGLLFIAVAALGPVDLPRLSVGTALRMGTGYVPRLLCWMLLGLGAIVLVQGLRDASAAAALVGDGRWRAVLVGHGWRSWRSRSASSGSAWCWPSCC